MTPWEGQRARALGIGDELIALGWRQGSIAKAGSVPVPFLSRTAEGEWQVLSRQAESDDWLVVISQSCDIVRDPAKEPYVEVMRAWWTTDEDLLRMARTNSFRFFLLRTREGSGGLVADAPQTFRIDKASVISLALEGNLDEKGSERFRAWVAGRYGRVALEQPVVDGVQRPIVEAVKKAIRDSAGRKVLDGIREVRVFWHDENDIELFLVPEDGVRVAAGEVAAVAGAIVRSVRDAGLVQAIGWDVVDLESLSAREYLASVQMPLDHYSLPEPAATEGSEREGHQASSS